MRSVRELNEYLYLLLGVERLLGTRPRMVGSLLIVVLIVGGIGFYWYQSSDPHKRIPIADRQWNNQQFSDAVETYQQILTARDPFLSDGYWMKTGRSRLYQRIVLFKSLFVNKAEARDWIRRAQEEGIVDLQFPAEEVQAFWDSEVR